MTDITPMNKSERVAAAEKIQKQHAMDKLFIHLEANIVRKAHTHRWKLITLLADAERENDALRDKLEVAEINTYSDTIKRAEKAERENDALRKIETLAMLLCNIFFRSTNNIEPTMEKLYELLNKQEQES